MNEENKEKGKDVSCVDRTTGLLIKKLLEAAPSQRFYHNGALHTLAPCSEPNFFRVEPEEAYLAGPEIVEYEFIAMADETYIAMSVEPSMDEKYASAVDKILGTPKEMREAERRAEADIALAKVLKTETKPVKEETAPPMYTAAIATAEDAAIRQNTQDQGTKACMSAQTLASYIDKVGVQSAGVEGKIDQDAIGAKVLGKKIIFVPEFMLRDTATLLQETGKCLLNVDGVLEEFRRIPHVYFMTGSWGSWAPEKQIERAFAFAESDDRVLCIRRERRPCPVLHLYR